MSRFVFLCVCKRSVFPARGSDIRRQPATASGAALVLPMVKFSGVVSDVRGTPLPGSGQNYREDKMSRTKLVSLSRAGLVCVATLLLTALAFAEPVVSLAPEQGPPTSTVLVSGHGFAADAAVNIYFDTTQEARALTSGAGAFSKIAIHVPSTALPGVHWVSAVQRSTGTRAQKAFLVQTNWVQRGFTPRNNRHNPYENVLSPSTVGSINLRWSFAGGNQYSSSVSGETSSGH
jgi:hypothetical protein